ncbi:hypothetical protein B296_00003599, partial [Ensete ventricosum]
VVYPTLRIKLYEEEALDRQLWEKLNLLDKKQDEAHLWALAYKKAVSDLTRARGKLASNLEGSYRVIDVIREGTCILAMMDRR